MKVDEGYLGQELGEVFLSWVEDRRVRRVHPALPRPQRASTGDPTTVWGWLIRAAGGSGTGGPLCKGKMTKHPHFTSPFSLLSTAPCYFALLFKSDWLCGHTALGTPLSPSPNPKLMGLFASLCASPPSSATQELSVAGGRGNIVLRVFFFPRQTLFWGRSGSLEG